MPNRVLKDQNYRFGFNGKEADREGQWGSTEHYDYGFRIYDPKIARFLSVDPLTSSYPMLTPYQFASNSPIAAIDLDGLESLWYVYAKSGLYGETIQNVVNGSEQIAAGIGKGTFNIIEGLSPVRIAKPHEIKAIDEAGGLIEYYKQAPTRLRKLPSELAKIPAQIAEVYTNGSIEQKAQLSTELFGLLSTFKKGEVSVKTNIIAASWSIKWKGFGKGKLASHFDKHGEEFGSISQREYLQKAKEFANEQGNFQEAAVGNILIKYDSGTGRIIVGTKPLWTESP